METRREFPINAVLLLALVVLLGVGFLIYRSALPRAVEVQIIQYSDWHGQLDPLDFPGEGRFGGAAELATYFRADEANNPNTLIITGGDDFGAAPPLSSHFDEIPSVLAQNLMGTDVIALGNHNFNRGLDHLQRMIDLADYQYLGANLENLEGNLSGVATHKLFHFEGIDIAVIGVANEDTRFQVFPGTLGPIEVTDAAVASQTLRDELAEQGVDVFILVGHIGVDTAEPPVGDLIDLANAVNGFDLILGDHSDVQYSGTINGALVIENRSKGRSYARIQLTVEDEEGVDSKTFEIIEPFSDAVEPAPDVLALLDGYFNDAEADLTPILGASDVAVPRTDSCGLKGGNGCESLIGNVVADAMRARSDADFAMINSGSLRAGLTCPVPDDPRDFCPEVVPPEHHIVQGSLASVFFPNLKLVTLSVTGPELKSFLERAVSFASVATPRFAQVSGLCFTADTSLDIDNKVLSAVRQATDGTCDDESPIDFSEESTYTLAITNYIASGGDGYPVSLPDATIGPPMEDVLGDYITDVELVTPTIQGRITCLGPNCPVPLP